MDPVEERNGAVALFGEAGKAQSIKDVGRPVVDEGEVREGVLYSVRPSSAFAFLVSKKPITAPPNSPRSSTPMR